MLQLCIYGKMLILPLPNLKLNKAYEVALPKAIAFASLVHKAGAVGINGAVWLVIR